MTRQEMFNRAVRGLASQGWTRCVGPGTFDTDVGCLYSDGQGKHCAWGWADPELSDKEFWSLRELRSRGVGVAGSLSEDDLEFALSMQATHDNSKNPNGMQGAFKRIALRHGLIWPDDVPTDQPIKETP